MELLLRRFALAIGLAFAFVGTQGPEFAQQYRQRLAGAVDELTRAVTTFDAEARGQGLAPDQAIARLEDNSDLLARQRGRDVADDKARLDRLRDGLSAAADPSPWRRMTGVWETADPTIARRAWADYQPAVPTTIASFVVAIVAGLFGWAATHIVIWPARRRLARRRELASA